MKFLFVSTFPPTACGIATFTSHLRNGMIASLGLAQEDLPVLAVVPPGETVPESPFLRTLPKEDREAYREAAEWVNASDVDVVNVQHEFGIFGGGEGRYLLDFLSRLEKPVITTFHTVFSRRTPPYDAIQEEILARSTLAVVMTPSAVRYLVEQYGIPPEKVRVIPHGAPAKPRFSREALRRKWDVPGRKVVLSFGLISRSKGIDRFLTYLPEVVKEVPELLYLVAGQTHPEVRRREGEAYREELVRLVRELGLEEHVRFVDRFLSDEELVELLAVSDVYITHYPGLEQISSGTLAYAVGLGRPVLSTPYTYARDLLGRFPDLLLPYGDQDAWSSALKRILRDDAYRKGLERRLRAVGRRMRWENVGRAMWELGKALAPEVEVKPSHG
ncbi:glycosyltransferase [Brockia lithotrophica]|uniref:Glycosyltransferase involved in cell wall biosynthesis n=1 Tax=Brockia lithotrophica TaxID=933949 RepID=A0A660L6K2_9BACL|nr:glycosyltransferase [Brockia lithotrophica]RKQ89058.1 glycosyltransferase involved in cell wall biosynthesis [Brockia lithotrophica]